ncbi:hypothetical protein VCHENC02_0655B, partial [Vibrio harveyi]|jgi:cadmium resistance protein CadD (predicted permease)
VLLF